MTVTEDNCVEDSGRILAGPFPTNAAAWRWIDSNTNDGLEHQDTFYRVGRAFDRQSIVGL